MQKNNPYTSYRMDLRTKILKCAMMNFRQKGIRAVKMDDIACQLSISKRTLYEIFIKKEDLLFESIIFNDEMQKQRQSSFIDNSQSVMDVLVESLRSHIDEICKTNPLFYTELQKYPRVKAYCDKKHEKGMQNMLSFMRKGVDEGFFREDVNYEIINLMADVFMKYVMDTEYYHKVPMPEIIKNVILNLLRGFCTEKGLKQVDRIYNGIDEP